MPTLAASHGPIEYDIEGTGRPIVLICGLGSQLIRWSTNFRQALIERGFQVIRFDNRDSGLSHQYGDETTPDLRTLARALRSGETPSLPYRMSDLGDDVVSLLDALDIARADIFGVSMGGFIAQHVASSHSDRVATLTLVMTSTGNPDLPGPSPEAQALLARRSAGGQDRDALIEQGMFNATVIASPAYPPDLDALRARVTAEIDRAYLPQGYIRQRAAILEDGDRRTRVERISVPTLVIHGTDDPLVPHQGGEELAALIPGARLHLIPGMGHEIPDALAPRIADAVAALSRSATTS
ncbi:MAG: alpha/beta hydrolase [Alphaproteobacteria bacterium HGW-Alphaproteobacteria-16]|nr:MAG: alpha/beta hydrolase [Alphaproteobacteria bacterium HGW-Alphaproteobacteria-16]